MVGLGIGVGAAPVACARPTGVSRHAGAALVLVIVSSACAAGGSPSGAAGAIGTAGTTGTAGRGGGPAGGRIPLPAEIVASLATTDIVIDATTGADLFDLTRAVGFAEGYAQCTCLAPELPAGALDTCAKAESGFAELFDPMEGRCILEQSRAVPGFDAYLQCRTKLLRELGRYYAECTVDPDSVRPNFSGPCTAPDGADALLQVYGVCARAFYCADGTFTLTGRCDLSWDCADRADERGCPAFICGDKLVNRESVCFAESCPVFDPPLCAPDDPFRFSCGDGGYVGVGSLCDGDRDCATGRDEAYCP